MRPARATWAATGPRGNASTTGSTGFNASTSRASRRPASMRSAKTSINSLRVVMLMCLVTSCSSRRTIRRVANYVRQQVSSGSSSDESMRRRVA